MYVSKRLVALIAGALVVAIGGGVAFATIPSAAGVISACYDRRSGDLRVIDAEAGATCSNREVALSWNEQGPQGPPGTVDTSSYYSKSESDARFVVGPGTILSNRRHIVGSQWTRILQIPGVAYIEVQCMGDGDGVWVDVVSTSDRTTHLTVTGIENQSPSSGILNVMYSEAIPPGGGNEDLMWGTSLRMHFGSGVGSDTRLTVVTLESRRWGGTVAEEWGCDVTAQATVQ